MQHLQLDRALACFDLETTGVDPEKDRIVQIAIIRVDLDGERKVLQTLVNPECPDPARSHAHPRHQGRRRPGQAHLQPDLP